MKYIITLVISFFMMASTTNLAAQGTGNEKIRAIKIGLITDKMKLSPEQSAKFWPIYNRYDNEMRLIRTSRKDVTNAKGLNAEEIIDERQKLDEKAVSLKAKYQGEFLNVISPTQLNNLYQAENEFRQYLLNRLQNK